MRCQTFAVLALALGTLVAGCSDADNATSDQRPAQNGLTRPDAPELVAGPSTEKATWRLAPSSRLTPDSTRIPVLVTRVGCNSGSTGRVLRPDVEFRSSEVVVTYSVDGESGGRCPDNNAVRTTLDLSEAIGKRSLIDGACVGATPRGQCRLRAVGAGS